jgi:cytochrome P450
MTQTEHSQGTKWDPWVPELLDDPYPYYDEMRASDPIYWSEDRNVWLLTRHADCDAVLLDNENVSTRRYFKERPHWKVRKKRPTSMHGTDSVLTLDPPDHTRVRSLANKAFSVRNSEAWRPNIELLADHLIDSVSDKSEVDFVTAIAQPFPTMVLCDMLGVPEENWDFLISHGQINERALDPLASEETVAAAAESSIRYGELLHEVITLKRNAPGNDVISDLVAAEEQGDRLTFGELVAMCSVILSAGSVTTVNLLGNAVRALLTNRDQLAVYTEGDEGPVSASDEFLRYDSVSAVLGRVAVRDFVLAGTKISEGEGLILLTGAANRDPAAFVDPTRLDVLRRPNPQLTFGKGTHYCLGAGLAKLEARILLSRFFKRFPEVDIAGPVRYRPTYELRGPEHLPLALGKRMK